MGCIRCEQIEWLWSRWPWVPHGGRCCCKSGIFMVEWFWTANVIVFGRWIVAEGWGDLSFSPGSVTTHHGILQRKLVCFPVSQFPCVWNEKAGHGPYCSVQLFTLEEEIVSCSKIYRLLILLPGHKAGLPFPSLFWISGWPRDWVLPRGMRAKVMCRLARKKLPYEILHAVSPYAIWMWMSRITLETHVLFGRCSIMGQVIDCLHRARLPRPPRQLTQNLVCGIIAWRKNTLPLRQAPGILEFICYNS